MADSFNIPPSIAKFFAQYDSSGKNKGEIDTLLEFSKLGGYLNGEYVQGTRYKDLSASEQSKIQQLYNSVKDKFSKMLNNPDSLPEITDENIEKYIDEEKDLYNVLYPTEDQEKLLSKIQNAMYQYLIDNGAILDELTPDNCNFGYIYERIKKRKQMAETGEKSLRLIETPYDNKKLEKSVQNYLKENNINEVKSDTTDLGNGKFDKIATQQTNTCWALAGINSLLSTEKGKELLETNLYYDKETGVFAIHLQEAEENGLHDGIYIVTPEEIAKESAGLAEGEGDVTAYLIAIEKYFEEVRNNPELQEKMESKNSSVNKMEEGNYNFRFFEILTGGQCSQYSYFDNFQVTEGITNGEGVSFNYETIYDMAKNKNGAIVLTIGNHAISVIGAKDGKLLIQESNNDEAFKDEVYDKQEDHAIFEQTDSINGAPTYTLAKENYNYIRATSFIKW